MNFLRFQNPVKTTAIPKMPEGECFRNVTMYAAKIGGTVVHGTVRFVQSGKRGDHAWIEKGKRVLDPTIGVSMDKATYYSLLEAVAEARYTEGEAVGQLVRCSHHGPWHK